MIIPKNFHLLLLGALILANTNPALQAQQLDVFSDSTIAQVDLVVAELSRTVTGKVTLGTAGEIEDRSGPASLVLLLSSDTEALNKMQAAGASLPGKLEPEGFAIRTTSGDDRTTIWLVGADPAGLLYGGYELAEQIRCYGLEGVREGDQNPYMAMRGIKFNIPLDVRTPSYTDMCDAAQENIAEMWNYDFWKTFIESLARHRYNYISCWSLHPFPSLVKVPGYEDVALDDVQRSTLRFKEHYTLEATDYGDPEILENVETLLEMTIAEKIAFWRKVMAYGKLHNIDFYFVTWNIFTYGTGGKYGITDEADNPVTRDYFRKSVKTMFTTYPDLKGIGLTTGENMHPYSFDEKEDWAFETYARGVMDAAAEQPGRKITLIHRQHMAGALEIAEKFKPVIDHPDIDFIYSYKYAKAHVYSSTRQPGHEKFVKEIRGKGDLETIWTLRNDDVFHFRWGSPDFVREFIENIPYDVSRGYYYGSDQYIWGREFLSREPESPRQIEIDKHWYQWMLWGRLGYDPQLSNERFVAVLQERFPMIDAAALFNAWQEASMIYPVTTGFHWGSLDFIWYIEACQARPFSAQTPTGFHDINRFITTGTHPGTDNISIPQYVRGTLAGKQPAGTTPYQAAAQLHAHADKALGILESLNYNGHKELRQTLDDIRTIAWLGKYYAHKIEAATDIALFRETLDPEKRKSCVDNLNTAAAWWRSYASLALSNNNNPLWTNRVGHVDWRKTYQGAIYDIRSVGGTIKLPGMQPSQGGTILEAEDAVYNSSKVESAISGYTGSGYVEMNRSNNVHDITWTFQAPSAGRYVIEIRYNNPWDRQLDCPVMVNGRESGSILLWESGNGDNWVWDRAVVELKKGGNRIGIHGGGRFYIDHLNVIPTGE